VPRVHGERCQDWEHRGVEPVVDGSAVFLTQVLVLHDLDALGFEHGDECLGEAFGELILHVSDHLIAGVERLERGELVRSIGRVGDLLPMTRLEQPDPLHAELVEVRGEDRHELQAFEQRGALVEGLSEHAPVKLKPR
jgi:hypothetical protein